MGRAARRISSRREKTSSSVVIMGRQRAIGTFAIGAMLLLGAWRSSSARTSPRGSSAVAAPPDACALLTEAEVSTAIESKSLPGKRLVASSPRACIWSDDPNTAISNRRVTLSIMPPAGFEMGKSSAGRITIVPVTGIGDDAYYEIFKSDSPVLAVRKGSTAFVVRILNGLKFKALSIEDVKAREAVLGKAAAARL